MHGCKADVFSALINGKHSLLKEDAGAAVLTTAGPAKQVEEVQIGWVTEAKDWAGELISGQSMTGRILVSCLLCPALATTAIARRSSHRPIL